MKRLILKMVAIGAASLALIALVAACTTTKEVPVEVIKEVIVEKEVPVEKIVVKEVPVEKEVVKEVVLEKVVLATPEKVLASVMAEKEKYGGIFRVTAQGSIKSMDPYFAPAYVTTDTSRHFLESPFQWDGAQTANPALVGSWEVSSDTKVWTFTLRDDLTFHDGSKVTSADVIASTARWMAKQPSAKFLKEFLQEDGGIVEEDSRTWSLHFKQAFGATLDIMAVPHRYLGVFPARIANAFSHTEDVGVDNYIGSAAFKIKDWEVGNVIKMERFEEYVPRSEPGDWLAGAQIAYLDEVHWLEIPSEETKLAGLKTAEFDMIDGAALDQFGELTADANISVPKYPFHQSVLQIHVNRPPFDQAIVRRAVLAGVNAEDYMGSLGPSDLWLTCSSAYYCGSPLETERGAEFYNQNDIPRAKALLAEAGVAPEDHVIDIMVPADYSTIGPLGLVLKAQLEATGFKTEMPGMDWATMVSKLPTDDYSIFGTWWAHWAGSDPITDNTVAGTSGYAGNWVNDDMLEYRRNFAFAATHADKIKWIDLIQDKYFEEVPRIWLGQFANIFPHRTYVKNMTVPAMPIYIGVWMEK